MYSCNLPPALCGLKFSQNDPAPCRPRTTLEARTLPGASGSLEVRRLFQLIPPTEWANTDCRCPVAWAPVRGTGTLPGPETVPFQALKVPSWCEGLFSVSGAFYLLARGRYTCHVQSVECEQNQGLAISTSSPHLHRSGRDPKFGSIVAMLLLPKFPLVEEDTRTWP